MSSKLKADLLMLRASLSFSVMIVFVGGAALAGGGHTMLRALRSKEKPMTIIFFFSLISSVILAVPTAVNFKMPENVQ